MEVLLAIAVIGVVLGGVHLAVSSSTEERLLPSREWLAAAEPRDRARLMRPYLIASSLSLVVVAALALVLGSGDGGPSAHVIVYVALPVCVSAAWLFVIWRPSRRS